MTLKTLANFIDYVRNLLDQIRGDAQSFTTTTETKRRESFIKSRLQELETNYADAKTLHLKIISAKEENDLKKKYFDEEIFMKLKEIFLEYQGALNEALKEKTNGTPNTNETHDKSVDIKLRRIEIPTFSGGYDQWRPFYVLYVSLIHTNTSLTDIQKLHYLKASLQGEAARLLQHISLEDKNYTSAWTILTDRYENKRVLVNTHLRILLTQKSLNTETASGIKSILDTTTECLHSLRNLEVPIDTWDAILIYVLSSKLPNNTQELWEESLSGAKNLVEFTTFLKFLETRFRTLESIDQSKMENKNIFKTSSSTSNFKQAKSLHTSFRNLHSNSQQTQEVCPLCKKTHRLHQCEQFLKMNVKTRYETVRKLSVCNNCLSSNHYKNQCTSTYRCRHCKQNHHSLLHATSSQPVHNNQRQFNGSSQGNHNSTSNHHVKINLQQTQVDDSTLNTGELHQCQIHCNQAVPISHQQCPNQNTGELHQLPVNSEAVKSLFTQHINSTKVLLATALINCQAANGNKITLRALVDPGSEATFITEAATQLLRLPKRKTTTNIISLGQFTTGTSHGQVTLTISSRLNTNFNLSVNAFVYANITSILPSNKFETSYWEHLQNLDLADPVYNTPGKIDVLLGADVYSAIILSGLRKGVPGAPIAQQTELGWIVSGSTSGSINKTIHTYHQMIDLDKQIRRFWEIEEVPEVRKFTEEEKLCE